MNDKEKEVNEIKLLPCPFCGGEAVLNLLLGNYCVTCTECLGAIFPVKGATKAEAITAWNTRKPMQRIVEILGKKKTDAFERLFDGGSRGIGYCEAIKIVKEVGGMNG